MRNVIYVIISILFMNQMGNVQVAVKTVKRQKINVNAFVMNVVNASIRANVLFFIIVLYVVSHPLFVVVHVPVVEKPNI